MSQNSQGNSCARDYFLIKLQVEACNFIKKETLTQVFSSEFCEISKNTSFHRTHPVAASELVKKCCFRILQIEYIIYKKHKKMHSERFEHIPCFFSGNIFDFD